MVLLLGLQPRRGGEGLRELRTPRSVRVAGAGLHAFEIARKRNEEWDAGENEWVRASPASPTISTEPVTGGRLGRMTTRAFRWNRPTRSRLGISVGSCGCRRCRAGSRDLQRAEAAAAELGGGAPAIWRQPGSRRRAGRGALRRSRAATVAEVADAVAGKILIDCVNPLGFDKQGSFPLPVPEGSAAQQAAALAPGRPGGRRLPSREFGIAAGPGPRRWTSTSWCWPTTGRPPRRSSRWLTGSPGCAGVRRSPAQRSAGRGADGQSDLDQPPVQGPRRDMATDLP